ncbi:MAG: macrolide ABC transporter ATP-binding protein [Deltaproteobacteria bacterium GWA2_57_13]|nr:MAG: macrolide ABC transporter ATP-binding protein [Deltaproteobacteria bacterium GWA2_57_13]OGQ52493.1 MAG: macrolide ABC transporter ATP-binding protein [Deltaproteobacteria bacterium RIFCSPLOWO2_02_FULL_57_26]
MIRLEAIRREFQVGGEPVHALNGVSLTVERGEYLSIMGPSGSGKSTLLHIIGLLDRPTAGRYWLAGRNVTGLSDQERALIRREKIGFVFQLFHLVPRLTAAQNIELPLTLDGLPPEKRTDRVQSILAAYGLAARARHLPNQLSGGERQRVAIARAAVTRPEILLADEPTGNLDRASGREVIELLERLNHEGLTLILVTHDPELGSRARCRLQMRDGCLLADGEAR